MTAAYMLKTHTVWIISFFLNPIWQHSDEEKLSIHKLTHIHTEDVKI